jgi:hypothetical protein
VDTSSPQTGGYFQILLLLALIIPAIFFMLTQQNTLRVLKPENRLMNPGLVWLQIIPLFGQIWQFFVVSRIAKSIRKEIAFRQDDSILGFSDITAAEEQGKLPTFAIGITYCSLYTAGIIINGNGLEKPLLLTMIGGLGTLGGMICWIVYWVQLGQYLRKLRRFAL